MTGPRAHHQMSSHIAGLPELLGIELPVIQAPMAGVQDSALAIAVSNAGGLGSLPCAMLDLEALDAELAALRDGTARPFNVNFFCHTPPAFDSQREATWRRVLAPYYAGYGIDPAAAAAVPLRVPFCTEVAGVVERFKPAVVSFHFGLPSSGLMARVKSWGSKVLASATTVAEARWLEKHGVDVIVAQGLEAGGHRGMFLSDDLKTQVGTVALVPQIVDAVRLPVVAAGGIADARGVASAMSLGAVGVQVGTAYMLCREATTPVVHRTALKSGLAERTALTNLFSGRPARGIVNRLMQELGPMTEATPSFPLASAALAPLRSRAESSGSGDFSPLWCGQNATGCKEISAARLTQGLVGAR
jgi:nitronate monooxygenase